MADLKVLAVITARGGSKGLPGKNIIDLGGKPLIQYSIDAAKRALLVDRVVVSTDDEEIARVSKRCGAEVPFIRPQELAGDTSAHIPVVQHAVQHLIDNEGYKPDYVLLLQPTSPFRTAEDIDAAIKIAIKSGAGSIMGVMEVEQHPFKLSVIEEQSLKQAFEIPEGYLRRQDFPTYYWENGAIYLVKTQCLMDDSTLKTTDCKPYVMSREHSLDIDDEFDLLTARGILHQKMEEGE